MQAVLAVTVPFFALVFCGWLAARRGWLPEAAIPGLNAYVLFFALPCLLFRFGAGTPVLELLNPAMLGVYVLVAVAIVFFAIGISLNERVGLKDAAFGALVAAFPNTGFMGVPLLVALLGKAAAGPVICTVLADLFVTSSLCIALAQWQGARVLGVRSAAARALRGALSNPLPWAIAAGALCSVTGLLLPGPLDDIVAMLAASATPVALFTIGAVLWRAGQHAIHRTRWADFMPVALTKLFVHPLLIFVGAATARHLGAPITPFQISVLTLAAALPSASNVSLLAERYGADSGRIARIVMASTVLAFFSFSVLATVLRALPA